MTRDRLTEEPCVAKVTSTVLKTSGGSDPSAEFHRALKIVVLHRKNALFFRTEHGAAIGDVIFSLVMTCRQNGMSAWDYLVSLMRNARAVRRDPARWLPWNYPAEEVQRRAA